MELQGKVALVTGAGSGIGAASALLLAQAGARVGALGHTEDELQATAARIRDGGGEAMPRPHALRIHLQDRDGADVQVHFRPDTRHLGTEHLP